MKCQSRFLRYIVAHRRPKTLAAALLIFAIFIGALGAAVRCPTSVVANRCGVVQQAAPAAPAGSLKAAPPPKTETPPPAESTTEILANLASTALPEHQLSSAPITTALINFGSEIREFQEFTSERKL